MNKIIQPNQVVDLPLERRWMPAFLELKGGKHCIYALLELDVTLAWQFIERYKAQSGEQISFTGYLIFCLAHAVAEDKAVQAYRNGILDPPRLAAALAPVQVVQCTLPYGRAT